MDYKIKNLSGIDLTPARLSSLPSPFCASVSLLFMSEELLVEIRVGNLGL